VASLAGLGIKLAQLPACFKRMFQVAALGWRKWPCATVRRGRPSPADQMATVNIGSGSRSGTALRAEGGVCERGRNDLHGQCYCGAVTIEVTGDSVGAAYCHCGNCRSWSAGPVNAFTLWKPEAVKVTQGEDQISEYHKTEQTYRQWCRVCGGHLVTRHPKWVWSMSMQRRFPSRPGCTSTTNRRFCR
jgi:hypothetical protein